MLVVLIIIVFMIDRDLSMSYLWTRAWVARVWRMSAQVHSVMHPSAHLDIDRHLTE